MAAAAAATGGLGVGELGASLRRWYGYDAFKAGQQEVIEAVLGGRDAAVFWATGAGKSLCYQLPALHANRTALVVSPLISLMQDQANQLNSTLRGASDGSSDLAVVLGSAEKRSDDRERALRGEYRVVFVSPELLVGSGWLRAVAQSPLRRQLVVVAVDEAHCVSEWGHDFRKDYRGLGQVREELPEVPLLALTASASPRVQQDVLGQLGMNRDPLVNAASLDRANLRLEVRRKSGWDADIRMVGDLILRQGDAAQADVADGATIVYLPRTNDVDRAHDALAARLASSGVGVVKYHGKLDLGARNDAHVKFLLGEAQVVVATVAFGMGINKANVRRVVHVGAPKTVEEYAQQVGRAGRDGLPSHCLLLFSDADFAAFQSEFYTRGLSAEALEATRRGAEALRELCTGATCRRRALLAAFEQEAPWGDGLCGTCDNCRSRAEDEARGLDSEEDATAVAALLLKPLAGGAALSKSRLLEQLPGAHQVRQAAKHSWQAGKTYYAELLAQLVLQGLVNRQTRSYTPPGSTLARSFEEYVLTAAGRELVQGQRRLLVPLSATARAQRDQERARAARAQAAAERLTQELRDGGVDVSQVPASELQAGTGPVIRAQLHWLRALKTHRDSGREDLAVALEAMLAAILRWRDDLAKKTQVDPVALIPAHVARVLAYTRPTSAEALRAAGVRVADMDDLVEHIAMTQAELGLPVAATAPPAAGGAARATMRLPTAFTAAAGVAAPDPGPARNGKVRPWKRSWERFQQGGETMQAIAASQDSGKPVQVGTVRGHLLTALRHGLEVNLARVAQEAEPPVKEEWQAVQQALESSGQSVEPGPAAGEGLTRKEIVMAWLGVDDVGPEAPVDVRDRARRCYDCIAWYVALRGAGFDPVFAAADGDDDAASDPPAAKRPRVMAPLT